MYTWSCTEAAGIDFNYAANGQLGANWLKCVAPNILSYNGNDVSNGTYLVGESETSLSTSYSSA